MAEVRSVWMLTFEAKPIVKVGGLGEVPPNLAASLVKRGVEAVIVMPSHAPAGLRGEEKRLEVELDGVKVSVGYREWRGVKFILFSGGPLDDPRVYAEDTMMDKVALLAKGLGWLLLNYEKLGLSRPDVIHFHDWHSVVSLLKARVETSETGWRPGFVYHIHLLVGKEIGLDMLEKAGVDRGFRHTVRLGGKTLTLTVEEALRRARGVAERLGAIESDVFVTVSRTYLREDRDGVLNRLGWDLEDKSGVIYNGTDWSYQGAWEDVLRRHGERLARFTGKKEGFTRHDLRRYFLLDALGNLPGAEPRQLDKALFEKISEWLAPPFRHGGKVEPFETDGPLVITTGRLSTQKGIDVLVEAVPRVLEDLGNAKFVFLVLPVWGGEEYARMLVEASKNYPYNVRVVFGIAPSIYRLAHLSADVFAAPSRWEPFGIMALEAMATGNPVVASAVGGLKEIVLDLRRHGLGGTGLHVRPGDPYELGDALRDMLAFMEASRTGDIDRYEPKIGEPKLRALLEEMVDAGEIVRKNAIERVEKHFTWDSAAAMALEVYKRSVEAKL